MSKKESSGAPTVLFGIVLGGVGWTLLTGSLWPWLPIGATLAVYFGLASDTDRNDRNKKGGGGCC